MAPLGPRTVVKTMLPSPVCRPTMKSLDCSVGSDRGLKVPSIGQVHRACIRKADAPAAPVGDKTAMPSA
jgi:hypothetical protein